ncbi:MAG: (2Fe-2S) ferredoxin domain-containing protein [Bacteroidota bacterium]
MKYKKHVFICTNQRPPGAKQSCGEEHGLALVAAFKEELRKHKIFVEIRAQKSGCIDVCLQGPALVVYPEGIFYGAVTISDVPEIVEEHLVNDRPVERLKLSFEKEY